MKDIVAYINEANDTALETINKLCNKYNLEKLKTKSKATAKYYEIKLIDEIISSYEKIFNDENVRKEVEDDINKQISKFSDKTVSISMAYAHRNELDFNISDLKNHVQNGYVYIDKENLSTSFSRSDEEEKICCCIIEYLINFK